MNRLGRLHEVGQGIWLDFLRRSLITGGGLERLIREDAVSGLTSNPTIFGKAISGSTDYDEAIRGTVEEAERTPLELFYDLALADVGMAADLFGPGYDASAGADGLPVAARRRARARRVRIPTRMTSSMSGNGNPAH